LSAEVVAGFIKVMPFMSSAHTLCADDKSAGMTTAAAISRDLVVALSS
jgi:hypothetical protein